VKVEWPSPEDIARAEEKEREYLKQEATARDFELRLRKLRDEWKHMHLPRLPKRILVTEAEWRVLHMCGPVVDYDWGKWSVRGLGIPIERELEPGGKA